MGFVLYVSVFPLQPWLTILVLKLMRPKLEQITLNVVFLRESRILERV